MAVTNFIWDELNDNVLIEADGDNTTQATYANNPEQFGEVISQKRDAANYYNFNGQGSTRALTADDQSVTDTFVYTAFGVKVDRTGSSRVPFQYQGAYGYYTDSETNDVYVRRRKYSTAIGRWLSQDTWWFIDGSNLYRYAQNHPTRLVDPSGNIDIERVDDNLDNIRCGDFAFIQWDFVLDTPAPCRGYFVQQVESWCDYDVNCINCNPSFSRPPDTVYYEAWGVDAGDELFWRREAGIGHSFTDQADGVAFDTICGRKWSVGTVKFFCEDQNHPAAGGVGTGDLGRIGRDPDWWSSGWWHGWGIGQLHGGSGTDLCTFDPGLLTSTSVEPDWWAREPVEGPNVRNFGIWWNCCPCHFRHSSAWAWPR